MTRPRLVGLVGSVWRGAGLLLLALLLLDGLLRLTLSDPDDLAEFGGAGGVYAQARSPDRYKADAYAGVDWSDDYWREFHDSKEMRWEPYVYFRRRPYAGRYIRVDERGLRSTWNPPGPAAGPRVWMLGGSALWGTGARDDDTIPSLVSRRLAESGRPCQVVNLGESGWVATQELVMLAREVQAGRVPDVVVFFDGVNEVAAARQGSTAGIPQNEWNRVAEFNLSDDRVRLARRLGQKLFTGLVRLSAILDARSASQAALDRDAIDRRAADAVRSYAQALRLAVDLGQARGFDVLAYCQPVISDRRAPSDYERRVWEAASAQDREWQAAFEAAVAASPDLAALPFESVAHLLDETPGPVFIDYCHVSEAGNAVVADAIVADLLPLLERRTAVTER
ncbi:MAG TPA: hypothetical protein VMV01_22165 [Planctomycetota bacterium]|nr:hypothetical protein [Planctomycetota bacterium]